MSGNGFSHTPIEVKKVKTSHRIISTKIPVPESVPILKEIYNIESHSMHGQLPIIWDRAKDFSVYDKWGNKWLDFSSTIFVSNAGHSNKRILKALNELIKKPLLHTYTFTSPERYEYIKYLISNTPKNFEKAFLLSAGTEATEGVLKLMRLNGIKKGKRKGGIICFEGNWHGRTLGAQMMGWDQNQKSWIGYTDPNIYHLPFPYPWNDEAMKNPKKFFRNSISKLVKEKKIDFEKDICGVMMETFQGWGAVFYPKEFVQEIQNFSKENDILLAFDEMQAGFGRTGELFGYMNYDVIPDLIACGKGASSSLPLSIVLGSKEIMDLPEIGSMSSTHSANPMVCAAGLANLKAIIEDGILENSRDLGCVFQLKLDELKRRYKDFIFCVNGKGLLAAVIFKKSGKPLSNLCDLISEKCMQKGLIVVHTGRESIKLAPPLTISKEALIEGLEVFEESIKESLLEIYGN